MGGVFKFISNIVKSDTAVAKSPKAVAAPAQASAGEGVGGGTIRIIPTKIVKNPPASAPKPKPENPTK